MIKSPTKKQWSILAAMCALLACMVFATYVIAFENINPSKLTFTPGYRNITVSWDTYESQLTTSTSLYAVYRATSPTGKAAHRIAELYGYATSYTDANVLPGQSYYYSVINGQGRDGLKSVNTSELVWSAAQTVPLIGGKDEHGKKHLSPHVGSKRLGVAARNQRGCKNCHVIHDSAASATNLIKTNQNSDEPNSTIALCEKCHMDSTSVEKNYVAGGLTATYGHTIKNKKNPNGLLDCSTCHGAHQDSADSKGSLVTSTFKKFGSLKDDIKVDPTSQNAACVGCHDDKNTWYTATHDTAYPSTSNPTKLTGQNPASGLNGYPDKGTFPGSTVSESATRNVHANIPAFATFDKGDCRYCHSAHVNGQRDQLLSAHGELRAMKTKGGVVTEEELTTGAYASFCLSCHNESNSDTPWSSAPDMESYITLEPGSTEASRTAFLNSNAGHRIFSPNADYAQGSALPCYTCHNPHGSATNELNFSDELGTNLKKNDDMCFTCHVTSDGYVCEDGNDGTVVSLKDAKKQTVVGLNRDGNDGPDANKLKLSDIDGHQKGSTKKCSSCHGDTHRPKAQEEVCGADGRKCTDCHSNADTGEYPAAETYKNMTYESSITTNTPAYRWTTQHTAHLEPAWKSFATNDTSQTGVYCEGCHAWGTTKLNGLSTGPVLDGKSSGSTLRAEFKSNAVAQSDYNSSETNGENGLCFSCHEAGSDVEAPTSGTMNSLNSINPTNYADCYHNYDVTITRKAKSNGLSSSTSKTFNANCSKCHNNAEPIADPANNKDKLLINAHYKDNTRLIAKIGILSDITRPLDHDAILKTSCDTCHGKGMPNAAHAGNRSGMCFQGCHSVEQVYSVAAHKSQSWYTNCQACHTVNRKTSDHPVAAPTCSTTGCHAPMAVHVRKNEGKCFSGCHSPGDILTQKKADGTLAHKATMSSFASCRSCHETGGTDAWSRMMNTRGMCFGCHSHKGDISGNAGKSYQGKDWYGATSMNIEVDGWTTHTNPVDSKKSYQTKEYIDSSGKVIGTEFGDEEGIFDDMYDTSTAIPSGDGKDTALDNTTKQILSDGMEVSGHQPNRFKNTWASVATLKPHVKENFTSIRCSECHNTHATSAGAMGGHTEWILTKKALPGKTGGVAATSYKDTSGATKTTIVYPDNTMPTQAIAADGSRLITLNDFWSRNELATPVKNALIAYYKSAAGGSMSTEDAETKFEELDYNGITAANVAQATGTAENVGLAGQWGKTVDVFCFRCHDEQQMANKAHQGTTGKKNEYSHKSASLACVNCHLPEIHGGKLEGLLTDRGAYDSNNNGVADANDPIVSNGPLGLTDPFSYSAVQHKPLSKNQYFYWVAYQNGGKNNAPVNTTPRVLGTNVPAAKLFSVKPDPSSDASTGYTGCSTDKSCHVNTGQRVFGEQSGSNWLNWDTDY